MPARSKKKTSSIADAMQAHVARADRRRLASVKATMATIERGMGAAFKHFVRALTRSGSDPQQVERAMRSVLASVTTRTESDSWGALERRHGTALQTALETPEVAAWVQKARAELEAFDEVETVLPSGGRKGKR